MGGRTGTSQPSSNSPRTSPFPVVTHYLREGTMFWTDPATPEGFIPNVATVVRRLPPCRAKAWPREVHWGKILSMLTWNLSGFDAAGHVVEEIKNPTSMAVTWRLAHRKTMPLAHCAFKCPPPGAVSEKLIIFFGSRPPPGIFERGTRSRRSR